MKILTKALVGSVMVAGAAAAAATPASARVGVTVNLGLFGPPVVAAPPPPAPVVPAYCYGAYYYANCGFEVYGEPVFWNGYWYNNAPYRVIRGRREFWVNGGWHGARGRGDFDRDHDRGRHEGHDRQ